MGFYLLLPVVQKWMLGLVCRNTAKFGLDTMCHNGGRAGLCHI